MSACNPNEPQYLHELINSSLKSASMDNGLQYNAIYWETGNRTYIPFWAPLTQKFTWKIIDDEVRDFLGSTKNATAYPFVFHGKSTYIRKYYGDPELSMIVPIKKTFNFTLNPTGTYDILKEENKNTTRSDIFSKILESAYKIDLKNFVEHFSL